MIPITKIKSLPQVSGIYKVLNKRGVVIYIGQAENIHARWKKGHHKLSDIIAECGLEAYIDWVIVPVWLLNRAEHSAISFYQPKFNMKKPPIV